MGNIILPIFFYIQDSSRRSYKTHENYLKELHNDMQTIRTNVDLPRVNNQFEWKISAVITSPSLNPAKWKDFISYTKKESYESITHTFTPRIFLWIQILEYGRMKGVDYKERCLNLDSKAVYRLQTTLQKIYDGFQIKNLYFYDNDVLKLNQEIANSMMVSIPIGDKKIKIIYATIHDDTHGTGDFEGIAIFINSYNVYITLTYFELGFMIDQLSKLNLTQMGFDMIQSVMKKGR